MAVPPGDHLPAAVDGEEAAQFYLGFQYMWGVDVPRNLAEAEKWFGKSAEQGRVAAMKNLGVLCMLREPPDSVEAAKWIGIAAERGDVSAQLMLGGMLFNGLGVTQDRSAAEHWLRLAADQGNAQATELLTAIGYKTNFGPETTEDDKGKERAQGAGHSADERVVELKRLTAAAEGCASEVQRVQDALAEMKPLQEAADLGDVEARQKLEKRYADARKSAAEYEESMQRYRKDAESGDATSQRKLGELLVAGAPVVMDQAEMESWISEVRDWLGKFRERMQAIKEGGEGPGALDEAPTMPRRMGPDPIGAAKWFRLAAEQGDSQSQRYLGEMYEGGKGVARNPEEATSWYRKAAEGGDVRGQAQYGVFLLARGVGSPAESEAVRWLEAAAEGGDVLAQYTLGILYESKRDNPEERVLAVPWLRMAAEQDHPESLFHLAELYHWGEVIPRDDTEAVRLYRKAVEVDAAIFRNLGFPATWQWSDEDLAAGLSWFGKLAEQGEPWVQEILAGLNTIKDERSVEPLPSGEEITELSFDPDRLELHERRHETAEQCRLAAEEGDVKSQLELGDRYRMGDGLAQDRSEAARWFRKAAEQGEIQGCLSLGKLYLSECGGPSDPEEAGKWFRKAAEQVDTGVLVEIGKHYWFRSPPQLAAEAEQWFRLAAERNDVEGQLLTGIAYFRGRDFPKDRGEAIRWLRAAAEQGNVSAQSLLGELFLSSSSLAPNYTEAAIWLRKAAEQGDALSQFRLGLLLADGLGEPQDDAEATRWFRRAAETAKTNGDHLISGLLAFGGRGVPQNYCVAAEHFRIDAKRGLSLQAAFFLGELYRTGRGVTKDDAEAVRWFRKVVEDDPLTGELVRFGYGLTEQDYAELTTWLLGYAEQGEQWAKDLARGLTTDADR